MGIQGGDPRKKWLYENLPNSKWGTEQITVEVPPTPEDAEKGAMTQLREMTVFKFASEQDSLVFQLRWAGIEEE